MRIGLAQTAPILGDVEGNLGCCLDYLAQAQEAGCQLVIFPECALSGYMFEDLAHARSSAVTVDGEVIQRLLVECNRRSLHCVIGVLVSRDEQLWNSSILIGPEGIIGSYDKTHIPQLGVDKYVVPGRGPYQVHQTAIGRIGLQICYDWRFPEVTRALALEGAELVVMPTCSPSSSNELFDYIPRTRAVENAVFFAMVNRIGVEGGVSFLGRSQVVDPEGRCLVEAGDQVGLVMVDVDIDQARSKDRDQGNGLYQLQIMKDRRPELYHS